MVTTRIPKRASSRAAGPPENKPKAKMAHRINTDKTKNSSWGLSIRLRRRDESRRGTLKRTPHQTRATAIPLSTPRAVERGLGDYFPFYNDERAHQGLDYRTPAEVLEAIGDVAHAVEYYEYALQKNPKIPVKRRLNALKKTVHGDT